MNYTSPREVKSPKISISNLEPIIDKGEWEYSVAVLDWEKKPRLAMRWNGGKGEDGKIHPGNPQSRGLPTWFVLPDEFDIEILSALKPRGGLGGGEINIDTAEEAVDSFLSKKNVHELTSKKNSDNLGLEETIIKIITNLKAQGKI